MRKRKPSEETISKYIYFLNDLRSKCNNPIDYPNLTTSDLHKIHQVSKSSFSSCLNLGFVTKTDHGLKWEKEAPTREMALLVLGEILIRNKKQSDVPLLPSFDAIHEALKEISEKITVGIAQNNTALKGLKIGRKEPIGFLSQQITGETLFTESDKRFDLIKAITAGVYKSLLEGTNARDALRDKKYMAINELIIAASDDLLNKSYPASVTAGQLVEQDTSEIGKCTICGKSIRANHYHSINNDGNYYCKKHSGDFKLSTHK